MGRSIVRWATLRVHVHAAKTAHEPKHQENDHDEAKNPAESGASVTTMRVIPAAASEQEDQYDDD
jgi:hypothetical protein